MTMTRRRTIVFVGLTAALLAATASGVMATTYYVFKNPDGSLSRIAGKNTAEWERWTDHEYDCRTGTCNLCGVCHQRAADLTGKRIIPSVHTAAYAKASVRLAPGQRVSWGPDAVLLLEQDRLCLFSTRNVKLLCYDPTSILIKDKSGQPAFVSWTRPPTLFALKPQRSH